jgi:hypothetical protein
MLRIVEISIRSNKKSPESGIIVLQNATTIKGDFCYGNDTTNHTVFLGK